MAFSTLPGSGGAPDSFVGTSGVDSIAIVDSTGNYYLEAQGDNDVMSLVTSGNPLYSTVVNAATLKGGLGSDSFTWTSANATTYVGAFLNGNADADTFAFAAGDSFLSSTIKGGQAADTINGATSTFSASLVNGNKDNDTLTFNGVITSSSLFGGQGNDTINGNGNNAAGTGNNAVTNSLINGDLGNDVINFSNNQGGAKSLNGTTINGGAGNDTITLTLSGRANETVLVNGDGGADTILGTVAGNASIFGGDGIDTITTGGADTTVTGGAGVDDISVAGGGVDRVSYDGLTQGGAAASATSGSNVAVGDAITNFALAQDFINFAAGSLVGTAAAAAIDGGTWDMNVNGVAINQGASGALATYAAAATAVGVVTGDAGDVGYFIQEITQAAVGTNGVYNIYQVTLGTDKTAANLTAADTVALVGTVTGNAAVVEFATTNVSFLG